MRLVLMLCLTAIACSSPTDAPVGDLGLLRVDGDSAEVAIPATATAGEPFTVAVTTIGLNSCWERSATIVRRSGSSVVIEPWDLLGGDACFPVLVDIHHEASLTSEDPGTVDVTIRGRGLGVDAEVVVERTFRVVVE